MEHPLSIRHDSRNNILVSAILQRKLEDLPLGPGCYLYKDKEDNLLYIGKAKNLKKRIKSYFSKQGLDTKTRRLVARIWDIEFILCRNELEALVLENNLIKEHRPPFNILLRDDKNYPYVKLTKEPFPKVYVTRKILKDKAYYFGPFFPASVAYKTAELVTRFFQIRDCDIDIDGKRGRACLKYQLHRCTAPCIGAVEQDQYQEQANEAKLFLDGKRDALKKKLEEAMWKASEMSAFEQAAHHRDALQQLDSWFTKQQAATSDQSDVDILGSAVWDQRACVHRLIIRGGRIIGRREYVLENTEILTGDSWDEIIQGIYAQEPCPNRIFVEILPSHAEVLHQWLFGLYGVKSNFVLPKKGQKLDLLIMAQENARLALEKKFEPEQLTQTMLESLKVFLGLVRTPHRIECFDISHGQGKEVVASMVTFLDGRPDKSGYRRFKLSQEINDDFFNMKEVVSRRYQRLKNENKSFPDLVLIDGGLGQLHAAEEALEQLGLSHLECASIAKKEELIFRTGSPAPLRIPRSSPVLQLLQRVRDEAHRFAITYHRKLREKRTLQISLLDIPGIGKITVKKLMQVFGSVANIKKQPLSSIAEAIGGRNAQRVAEWIEKN